MMKIGKVLWTTTVNGNKYEEPSGIDAAPDMILKPRFSDEGERLETGDSSKGASFQQRIRTISHSVVHERAATTSRIEKSDENRSLTNEDSRGTNMSIGGKKPAPVKQPLRTHTSTANRMHSITGQRRSSAHDLDGKQNIEDKTPDLSLSDMEIRAKTEVFSPKGARSKFWNRKGLSDSVRNTDVDGIESLKKKHSVSKSPELRLSKEEAICLLEKPIFNAVSSDNILSSDDSSFTSASRPPNPNASRRTSSSRDSKQNDSQIGLDSDDNELMQRHFEDAVRSLDSGGVDGRRCTSTDRFNCRASSNTSNGSNGSLKGILRSSAIVASEQSSTTRSRTMSRDRSQTESRDRSRTESRDRTRTESKDRTRTESRDREQPQSADRFRTFSRDRTRSRTESRDRVRTESSDRTRTMSRDSLISGKLERLRTSSRSNECSSPPQEDLSEREIRVVAPTGFEKIVMVRKNTKQNATNLSVQQRLEIWDKSMPSVGSVSGSDSTFVSDELSLSRMDRRSHSEQDGSRSLGDFDPRPQGRSTSVSSTGSNRVMFSEQILVKRYQESEDGVPKSDTVNELSVQYWTDSVTSTSPTTKNASLLV
mmetsp:Transcript_11941/g.21641  ORF Transcript_11941/g.21641 Transcript_11941/m.21641 type:complete len:595 (-) Transcript_11941:703-2487(-)